MGGFRSGQVCVFRLKSSTAGQCLRGQAAGDEFGFSVHLSAVFTTLPTGARPNLADTSPPGFVQVYSSDNNKDRWLQVGGTIHGTASRDISGDSVGLSSKWKNCGRRSSDY